MSTHSCTCAARHCAHEVGVVHGVRLHGNGAKRLSHRQARLATLHIGSDVVLVEVVEVVVVVVVPQTSGVPPPPQVSGAVHVPQLPPQPSSPHSLAVQSGVQHTPNLAPDALTHTPLFPLVPQQLRL